MSKIKVLKSIANKMLDFNLCGNIRMVFCHIAKCGGVSTDFALKRNFLFRSKRLTSYESLQAAQKIVGFNNALDDDYHAVLEYRDKLLHYFLESDNTRYISGHFCFSKKLYEEYGDKFVFVTMLRNPVERFLSSYFFNASKDDGSQWKVSCSLRDYVETDHGKNLGHDYVKFIGGLRDDRNYCSTAAIEQAMTSLKFFTVVGILEKPSSFENDIKKKLGFKVRLGKSNLNPVPKSKRMRQINNKILFRINEICEPDMIIYKEAVKITEA